jgi:hypothetical protein
MFPFTKPGPGGSPLPPEPTMIYSPYNFIASTTLPVMNSLKLMIHDCSDFYDIRITSIALSFVF